MTRKFIMLLLYSCFSSNFTPMPWFEAGVTEGSPPEVAAGDVLELRVYDDGGQDQGSILIGVWRVAATYKGGSVVEGRFLAASDVYFQWWMNEGEPAPDRHRGWYHLCAMPTKDCPETVKYKNMLHSDKYRNLGPKTPSAKRVAWLSDKIFMSGCLDKFNKFREGLGRAAPAALPMKSGVAEPEARWAGDDGDPGDETPGEESSEDESEEDESMRGKITQLREQLKKAEAEALDKKRHKKANKRRAEKEKKKKAKKERAAELDPGRPGDGRNKGGDKKKDKREKRSQSPSRKKRRRGVSSEGEEEKKENQRSVKSNVTWILPV